MKKPLLYITIILSIAILIIQCAKRGTPTGGPIDQEPPKILRAYPDNYSINFTAQEIKITFDEYIKLNDLQSQLVVSPPLKNKPTITPQSGASRTMTIIINDTLEDNTTYTFNFGQSIVDHNESNPYPYYKYVLSTGSYIDSLQVKGKITDALNNTIDDYVNVLLYKMDQSYTDSIVFNGPPLYVFNTLDSLSTFTIDHLAAGTYRMVGIKETNNNLKFDKISDKIGFVTDHVVVPSDTVYEIKMYQPDLDPSITSVTHQSKTKFNIGYTGRLDSLHIDTGVDMPFTDVRMTRLDQKDTLQLWFKPALTQDTVAVALKYKDFTDQQQVTIKDLYQDSLVVSKHSDLSLSQPFVLTASTPIEQYDVTKFKVIDKDSMPTDFDTRLDRLNNLLYLDLLTSQTNKYNIQLLPNAITDFYGNSTTDTLMYSATTRALSDFGNIEVTLKGGPNQPIIAQVIDKNNKVVAQHNTTTNNKIMFEYLDPGSYLIRIIYDVNANGRFDPGNFIKSKQPEKVVYLPRTIVLQANWDVRENFILD